MAYQFAFILAILHIHCPFSVHHILLPCPQNEIELDGMKQNNAQKIGDGTVIAFVYVYSKQKKIARVPGAVAQRTIRYEGSGRRIFYR